MKKNLLTIIVMAATLVNLVLMVVMMFAVVPAMNKSNNLIDKIASVIDLEIDSENKEEEAYTIEDMEPYTITLDNKQTVNLKQTEGDSKSYYAIFESITISYNIKADDYEKIKESVEKSNVYIIDIIKSVITEYDVKTLNEETIKNESLKRIQEFYNSKAIVSISLGGFMHS